MPDDPVLSDRSPESRSQDIEVILYGGAAVTVRGTVANADTSPGEAGAQWADAGPLAWIAYDGDPTQIEFIQYTDPGDGRTMQRRVIKGERIGSRWNTVKINLAREAAVFSQQADFAEAEFDPLDFATG